MTIRFDLTKGVIHVPALVTGPLGRMRLRLVLDTGASRTIISRKLLMKIGYLHLDANRFVALSTASEQVRLPIVTVQEVASLGLSRTDLDIIAHDIPTATRADGLLGLDFFRDQRLVIDLRQQTVLID